MSQVSIVTRLAVHELWISFRLLVVLAGYVGAGAVVALVPAPIDTTLMRLAVGVAVAMTIGAVVAAWSLSRERVLGRAGWLATRSVPRTAILTGWFAALALVTIAGLFAAGILGWLAATTTPVQPARLSFGLAFAAAGCVALALVALGLAIGALLPPRGAALGAAIASFVALGAPWLAVPRVALPPESLGRLLDLPNPMSIAVQGAGVALVGAALLLMVAARAWGRVDL